MKAVRGINSGEVERSVQGRKNIGEGVVGEGMIGHRADGEYLNKPVWRSQGKP